MRHSARISDVVDVVTRDELFALAIAADVDVTTVARALRGEGLYRRTRRRIIDAALALGITLPVPEETER